MNRNIVASVLARLRNIAKSSGAPFQHVLQHYAIERFLYRVSRSAHRDSVILKGALLLRTIDIPNRRPTMDIDMLRRGAADTTTLLSLVRDCAQLEIDIEDGIVFLADSAVAEKITKESDYQGTRILMDARMDNVRLRVQIDFGVGDTMVPGPRVVAYPALLSEDAIQLLAYPIESSIAEKLQAMVSLGSANSRMKDFYDVWTCLTHLQFESDVLLQAVDATFRNRRTPFPAAGFDAISPRFAEQHRTQWNAFVRKIGEDTLQNRFADVIDDIGRFAMPLFQTLVGGGAISTRWSATRGWA